jgi:hypothetical protein
MIKLLFFLILQFFSVNAFSAFQLTNGFYAWRETSGEDSISSYLLDLRLGYKMKSNFAFGVISETDYYKNRAGFYEIKSYGVYSSYTYNALGFSASYLPAIQSRSTGDFDSGVRLDAYQMFSLTKNWKVGPRLTFRNFMGDKDLSSLKPTFFSEISF